MKKHSISKIRRHRIYDARMLTETLGVHRKTIGRWIKQGLEIIPGTHPCKFWGQDIIIFLEVRQKKNGQRLNPGELFCLSCRAPRLPLAGSIKLEKTGKRIGKSTKQVIIRATCSVCGGKLSKFSSERRENGQDKR